MAHLQNWLLGSQSKTFSGHVDVAHARYWHILLALVWVTIFLFIMVQPLRVSQDAALELQTAQLMLEGKAPYVDYFHIDPPLIIYLSAIPVFLAGLFSVNVIPVFSLLVWVLIIWSTLTIRRLLLKVATPYSQVDLGMLLLTWTSYSLLILLTSPNFGQREHLFILLYFPFFILRWIRWEGGSTPRSTAIWLGVMAGLGTFLKPQFGLIALGPELYWSISRRSLKPLLMPEVMAFVGFGLGYLIHFLFLPQAMQASFFGRWLPFILRGYQVYNTDLIGLITLETIIFATIMGLFPFVVEATRPAGFWGLLRPLAALTLGAVLVYLLQAKGWTYHALPAFGWALMILAVSLVCSRPLAFRDSEPGQGIFRVKFSQNQLWPLVLVGAVGLCAGWVWERAQDAAQPDSISKAMLAYSQEGDSVLVISTSVRPAYPALIQLNRRPGSRYLWAFPIAMLYSGVTSDSSGNFPYRSLAEAPPEEIRFLDELAEDIATIRPQLIFIDIGKGCSGCPAGFVIGDYLQHAGFAQNVLQPNHYALQGTIDKFALFRLEEKAP